MPSNPRKSPKKSAPNGPYFASVAVVVSDPEKSLDWYTNKLGLDVIDHEDHWITVGRKGRGGKLHLCGPLGGERPSLEPGNSGILLLLPGKDFQQSCAELERRGVVFSLPPTTESWGTYAMVRDPDGNEHSLMPEA